MSFERNGAGRKSSAMTSKSSIAEFWLNLQNFYDLECERRAGKALEIERQVQPVGAE